jgi:hypothetical protein
MRSRYLKLQSARVCAKGGPRGNQSDAIFGYTFGYRHQFGFFTLNYAKLLSSMYLAASEITLSYAYLS